MIKKELINTLLTENKTYKARTMSPYFVSLSHGNKKLKENARVAFLVWNIPAVTTCPYRTAHCEALCYALKAENQYTKSCRPARQRNFELSRAADFVTSMIFTIYAELDRPANKDKKIVFRIHESGDFYNKQYVSAWLEIINHFSEDPRITFVAYTKSVVFFDGIDIPNNLNLLASVWDDTKESNLEIIRRNNFRIYTAFSKEDMQSAINSGFSFCPCKDCGSCGKCWNNFINNVACEIH